jgi:IclR family KDG regulon transcriptional repressor
MSGPRSRAYTAATGSQAAMTDDGRVVRGESLGGVKSAERTYTILEYLADAKEASFASLVRDLGLPNSSGHQLLHTAVNRGYVEFDEARRTFRLGYRLWEVAQSYRPAHDIVTVAQRLMDELRDVTKETVQLARLDGLDTHYLAIAESPHPMKLVSHVGARLAAHATALGKALLAELPEQELDRRLRGATLARFTDRTITDRLRLEAELHRIRAKRLAEDNEEYIVGCRCVAMPVRARGGMAVAVSVSVPVARYNRDVARVIRTELARCVHAIERGAESMLALDMPGPVAS